ncbi:MAG: YicC/YloC family endoribonuclease [Gemmiger qucibialis]
MVLSMTGYGRAEQVLNGRDIVVELRSVNSRFFEYSSRVPRTCSFLEDKLKKLVAAKVSRGKVELNLSIQNVAAADTVVQVNWQLAKSYQTAMQAMSEKLDLKNDVTVSTICRFPDVLTQTAAPADPDTLWADVEQVAQQAVAAFVSMRAVEGEKLRTDVLNRLATIETLVAQIEQNSAGRVQAYTERLYTRLKELLEDRNIDDARIVTEAAIFADKTAIDEETVRLHSHVAQYRSILELDEPVGRKLDFLTQELNRESNTIGSKCQDINITRLVVELKSEIEKIREQIQNIE